MLFNSLQFPVFLVLVFAVCWPVQKRSARWGNLILFVASYVFYGWWDWRFLSLIFFSSVVDYTIGLRMHGTTQAGRRKVLLCVSLFVNLGLLATFKYLDFFIASFADAFAGVGITLSTQSLWLILPVGISFYTFQTLSYTIDIYRGHLKPTRNLITFLAFVSFFPQLVAGPIERAKALLPQFERKRVFDPARAKDGLRRILWGLFKKMVIADTCAIYVDRIFADPGAYGGSELLLGVVYFAFQIYGDFSGYSDVAIGVAKLLGFELTTNFALPYFSRSIPEFWERWHISLSSWFRDYVYIPLGGSRLGKLVHVRNALITFTVSGLWHGANWTFVVWGFLNGLYYIPVALRGGVRGRGMVAQHRFLPTLREFSQMTGTFTLILLGWVLFRADSMTAAFQYLDGICSSTLFDLPSRRLAGGCKWILLLLGLEWVHRNRKHAFEISYIRSTAFRWPLYLALILMIVLFGKSGQAFIYFQF